MAADEQEWTSNEVCIGSLCFQKPFPTYVPPPVYPQLSRKQICNWKVKAIITSNFMSELKIGRVYSLPKIFGLGDDGRWRWRWIPISMLIGLKGSPFIGRKAGDSLPRIGVLSPYIRLKSLTPAPGKMALQPVLEISAVPSAEIRRKFLIGQAMLAIVASIKVTSTKLLWDIQLTWDSTEQGILRTRLGNDALTLEYLRIWTVNKRCCALVSSAIRMLVQEMPRSHYGGNKSYFSLQMKRNWSLKEQRDEPLQSSAYLKASDKFGQNRSITVVPGHYIDAGKESGASGEREFNLEIADLIERDLHSCGWRVLRPDRDAPHLTWEEYLNWVSRQTLQGQAVVEIHGQGSAAAFQGKVSGVIGDPNMNLSKELAKKFGFFELGWRQLGVPRRGGIIVESFNSDEVLQMVPWQRLQASKDIANKFVQSIRRASSGNQPSQSVKGACSESFQS